VCIPPPRERSPGEDGGPLRYRVVHRVARWTKGQRPQMQSVTIEGDPGLSSI
jgi:alkaline phosphatase D